MLPIDKQLYFQVTPVACCKRRHIAQKQGRVTEDDFSPLQGTTTRHHFKTPLQTTISTHLYKTPLQGTTTRHHFKASLQGTTSRHHYKAPLQGTKRSFYGIE